MMKLKYTVLLLVTITLSGCVGLGGSDNIASRLDNLSNDLSAATVNTALVFQDPELQAFYDAFKTDFYQLKQMDWSTPPTQAKLSCSDTVIKTITQQLEEREFAGDIHSSFKMTTNNAYATAVDGSCKGGSFTGRLTIFLDRTRRENAMPSLATQVNSYVTLDIIKNKIDEHSLTTVLLHTEFTRRGVTVGNKTHGGGTTRNNHVVYFLGTNHAMFSPNFITSNIESNKRVLKTNYTKVVSKNPNTRWVWSFENGTHSHLMQTVIDDDYQHYVQLVPASWPLSQHEKGRQFERVEVGFETYRVIQACMESKSMRGCSNGVGVSSFLGGQSQAESSPVSAHALLSAVPNSKSSAAAFKRKPSDIKPIKGNFGSYMSPFLADGRLAEWAAGSSTAANIAGAVGGAAGAYAAHKALESVPLGGLVAARFGDKAGSKLAKGIVVNRSSVKASSDLSFNDVNDMAVWLVGTHGKHPLFNEAMQKAVKIYPELNGAYARVLSQ